MKALRPIAWVVMLAVGLTTCGPEPVPAFTFALIGLVMLPVALARVFRRRP